MARPNGLRPKAKVSDWQQAGEGSGRRQKDVTGVETLACSELSIKVPQIKKLIPYMNAQHKIYFVDSKHFTWLDSRDN